MGGWFFDLFVQIGLEKIKDGGKYGCDNQST